MIVDIRIAITEASARLFREQGVDKVSVAELMAAAGLTHGGFYGHFESKEELAGDACRWAFDRSAERWEKRIADKGNRSMARAALTDNYLSAQARSGPTGRLSAAADGAAKRNRARIQRMPGICGWQGHFPTVKRATLVRMTGPSSPEGALASAVGPV